MISAYVRHQQKIMLSVATIANHEIPVTLASVDNNYLVTFTINLVQLSKIQ